MSAVSKIGKYNLQDRTLALAAEGKSTDAIAKILTEELEGKDSISQTSVAAWLKKIRQERSEETRHVVREYIKNTVPKDMEALNEIEAWLLDIFRNQKSVKDPETGKVTCSDLPTKDIHDLPTRSAAGMKAVKIIETKLRFAGLLENPDIPGSGFDPVDLEGFRKDVQKDMEKLKKEGANG